MSERARLQGFALLHKRVAYLLASLGLVGMALGAEVDLVTIALLALAYAATWFAEGPRLHEPRWERTSTIALLVALAVQATRGLLGEPILPLGLGFSGMLQVSRLANRRSAREHLQITLLAFGHLAVATLLTTELIYGFIFLGFVIALPWMLALTHLRGEIEAQHRARSVALQRIDVETREGERATVPPSLGGGAEHVELARVLASRRLVGGRFLAGTTLLSVPLFASTALLFVLFPRVGLGMLAFGGAEETSVAGFGNEVELGQVGRIRDDARVVLRVTPSGLDADPPRYLGLHLRGTAFDHYDGRRWSRPSSPVDAPVPSDRDEYVLTRPIDRARQRSLEIELIALDQPVLFLPEGAVALEIPARVEGALDRARQIVLRAGTDLRYRDQDGLSLRYVVWVTGPDEPPRRSVFDTPPTDAELEVPEGHERLRALALEWTAGARTDRERAERIAEHLRSPPFRYSLVMRDPGRAPPLERFLFDWQEGHCEYYASAMAILLRTLGIPTRNVTGFLGGTWNEYGRYYAVRSGDAHAWVEAYVPDEGWITFDPTPPERDAIGLGGSLWRDLRDAFDALVAWWERDVVSFDLRSQRALARGLFTSMRRSPEASRRIEDEARPERSPVGGRALLVLAPLLGLGGLWLAWRLRARTRRDAHGRSMARASRLYRALERALRRRGVPRPPESTPMEHARSLEAAGFPDARVVERVTRRYNEARFGERPLDDEELAELEAAVRRLRDPR